MVCAQQRRNSWVLKSRRTSFDTFQDGRSAQFSLTRRSMNRPLPAPDVVEVVQPAEQEIQYVQREEPQTPQQSASSSNRAWWASKFRLPHIGLNSSRRHSIAGQPAAMHAFNGNTSYTMDIPRNQRTGTWIRASPPSQTTHQNPPYPSTPYSRPYNPNSYQESCEVYPGFNTTPFPSRVSVDGGWGGRPLRPARTGSLDFWSSAMALAGYGQEHAFTSEDGYYPGSYVGRRRDLSADYNNYYGSTESSPYAREDARWGRGRASSASSFQSQDRSVPVQIEGGDLSSRRPSSAYNWSPVARQNSVNSMESPWGGPPKSWNARGQSIAMGPQRRSLGQGMPDHYEMEWEGQFPGAETPLQRRTSKERRRGLLVTESMHARMGFDEQELAGSLGDPSHANPASFRRTDSLGNQGSEVDSRRRFLNGRENPMLDSFRNQSVDDSMDYQEIAPSAPYEDVGRIEESPAESPDHEAMHRHPMHYHHHIRYSNIHYDDMWNIHPSQYNLLPRPPSHDLVTDTAIYHRSLFFEQFVLHDEGTQSDDRELAGTPVHRSSDGDLPYEEYGIEGEAGLPPPSEHISDSNADLDYPTTIPSFSERSCEDGIAAEYAEEEEEEGEAANTVKCWLDELEERGAYRRKECSYRIACQRAFMKQMKDKMQASKLAFDRLRVGLGPELTEKVLALRRKFGGRRRSKIQEKIKRMEEAELQDIWDGPMLDEVSAVY